MNGLPEYGVPSMQAPLPNPGAGRPANRKARSFPMPKPNTGRRTFRNLATRPKDARPGGRTTDGGR